MSLLVVNGLGVRYGDSVVLDDVSFTLAAGEAIGLVGESGSGKTQTALAILGLLPRAARVDGSIRFADTEIDFGESFDMVRPAQCVLRNREEPDSFLAFPNRLVSAPETGVGDTEVPVQKPSTDV